MLKKILRACLKTLGGSAGLFFLSISTVWVVSAQNLSLTLRNGDKLSGTWIGENKTNLLLKTIWAEKLEIPHALILNRQTNAEITVAKSPAAPAVSNVSKKEPTLPKVTANKTTAKPATKPPQAWHGDVQLGTDLGFSEKNRKLYYGRFKITYAQDKFKTVFDYNGSYGKIDGILSVNRMDGSAKTDFDLNKKWYVYNLAGAGFDEIRKIDLRYEIGPGVGYHLITRTNFVMNLESGINYQAQYFSTGVESEHFYFRLAENVTWKISKKVTWDEKFEYFPRVEDLTEFRLRFETNLRYWISDHLSFNLTLLDLYDTQPANNVSRNDLQIRSSVGIKF